MLKKKLTIVFIEGGILNCEYDAGSTANLAFIKLFLKVGASVHYIYTGNSPVGRLSDLNLPGLLVHNFSRILDPERASRVKDIDPTAIVISRPGPASEWLSICESLSRPIIYFGHDIHHIRLNRGMQFSVESNQTIRHQAIVMKIIEQSIWKRANISLYPTQWEADLVDKYLEEKKAYFFPIYDVDEILMLGEENNIHIKKDKPNEQTQLLYVGGCHHAPNVDGLDWFIKDIGHLIHIPFKLKVVGFWTSELRAKMIRLSEQFLSSGQKIEFLGIVDASCLYGLYREVDLVIAPLRFGAGLKRKVIEPLVLGVPLVSTGVGLEGILMPAEMSSLISSDLEASNFAKKIMMVLNLDKRELKCNLQKVSNLICAEYSEAQQFRILGEVFRLLNMPNYFNSQSI